MSSTRQEDWRLFNLKFSMQIFWETFWKPPYLFSWLEQYLYICNQTFYSCFKANCESRPMVLKVTFCTGAIKSSNLCWWTRVIISVKISLVSSHYKWFKHHHVSLLYWYFNICPEIIYFTSSLVVSGQTSTFVCLTCLLGEGAGKSLPSVTRVQKHLKWIQLPA